jgi:hypothetical protein
VSIRRVFVTVAGLAMTAVWTTGADAQVKIAPKYTEGRKTSVKLSTVKVGARRDDGMLPISTTIDKIRVKMLIAGMEYVADSEQPELKIELPQLAYLTDVIKGTKGLEFTVVLDRDNKYKFVEGLEKNLSKSTDLDPRAAAALKSRLDADRIKTGFEQSLAFYPDGLVREGETWDRTETTEIGPGQQLTLKRKYEYKGTVRKDEKTLDKITFTASDAVYKPTPEAESGAKVTKGELKVESAEGTILFDREAGLIVERKDNMKLAGTLTLEIANKEYETTIRIVIDSTATYGPAPKP